jgi:hypothetical protein
MTKHIITQRLQIPTIQHLGISAFPTPFFDAGFVAIDHGGCDISAFDLGEGILGFYDGGDKAGAAGVVEDVGVLGDWEGQGGNGFFGDAGGSAGGHAVVDVGAVSGEVGVGHSAWVYMFEKFLETRQ